MITINGEPEYLWTRKANPFQSREYTYLYYSQAGVPKGYMTIIPQQDKVGIPLHCKRFVFSDLEGFYGLINLLLSTAANHESVRLPLPPDMPPSALFPECSLDMIQWKHGFGGMARVVNVEKVLGMACTRGAGRLTLDITDEQIAQNNGRFEVICANGGAAEVHKTAPDEGCPADLKMGIQDFSRLIAGRFDVADFMYLPAVEMRCTPELAAMLFYRKPLFICEPF